MLLETLAIRHFVSMRLLFPCWYWMIAPAKSRLPTLSGHHEVSRRGRYMTFPLIFYLPAHFLQALGYALFIEVPDLDMLVVNHLNCPLEWKVRLDCLPQFLFSNQPIDRRASDFIATTYVRRYTHCSRVSNIGPWDTK